MKIYQGKTVSNGIIIGKFFIEDDDFQHTKKEIIEDEEKEVGRFLRAKEQTEEELQKSYEMAMNSKAKKEADIFWAQSLILKDSSFVEMILNMISSNKVNAEYAVFSSKEKIKRTFLEKEDEVLRSRIDDLEEISQCLLRKLKGTTNKKVKGKGEILLKRQVLPIEVLDLLLGGGKAVVMEKGTPQSHAAIIARTSNVPMLIDIPTSEIKEGGVGIVDGECGVFIQDPDEDTLRLYKEKVEKATMENEKLKDYIGKEAISKKGEKIGLYANVGGVKDLDVVLKNDAMGIGLFRSECLYLGREESPSEEEQFLSYKKILTEMGEKEVWIRTLDLGADKEVSFLEMEKEENPALGMRGIRMCFQHEEIFRVQLRALLKASVYGNLGILYPMIISCEEVRKIKTIVEEVKAELLDERVSFHDVKQGIMIETPAAVMMSDLLAKEVDYFSIGTNDLTQYTFAIDRQSKDWEQYSHGQKEVLLRMIEMVVKNAHKEGIPVGICGELAGDKTLLKEFLKMGIDELSVVPSKILALKKEICELR